MKGCPNTEETVIRQINILAELIMEMRERCGSGKTVQEEILAIPPNEWDESARAEASWAWRNPYG